MVKIWKSIGLSPAEAGHDVKFVGFGSRFCVATPLRAPWRLGIQLILGWGICLGWMDATKLENKKSVEVPPTEAGHDMKSAGFGSRFCVMSPLAAPWRPRI